MSSHPRDPLREPKASISLSKTTVTNIQVYLLIYILLLKVFQFNTIMSEYWKSTVSEINYPRLVIVITF